MSTNIERQAIGIERDLEKNLSGHRMKGPLELVCQFGLQSILSLSISYIFHQDSLS